MRSIIVAGFGASSPFKASLLLAAFWQRFNSIKPAPKRCCLSTSAPAFDVSETRNPICNNVSPEIFTFTWRSTADAGRSPGSKGFTYSAKSRHLGSINAVNPGTIFAASPTDPASHKSAQLPTTDFPFTLAHSALYDAMTIILSAKSKKSPQAPATKIKLRPWISRMRSVSGISGSRSSPKSFRTRTSRMRKFTADESSSIKNASLPASIASIRFAASLVEPDALAVVKLFVEIPPGRSRTNGDRSVPRTLRPSSTPTRTADSLITMPSRPSPGICG